MVWVVPKAANVGCTLGITVGAVGLMGGWLKTAVRVAGGASADWVAGKTILFEKGISVVETAVINNGAISAGKFSADVMAQPTSHRLQNSSQ